MKYRFILSMPIVLYLSFSLIFINAQTSLNLNENSLTSESNLKWIESNINIEVSDPEKYQEGTNVISLFQGTENQFQPNNSYFLFFDMEGKITQEPLYNPGNRGFQTNHPINETTFVADLNGQPMMWNTETNVTVYYEDIFEGFHHDFQFNPETETFLALEWYLDEVINQTGQLQTMLMDRISEYDLEGNLVWRWFLKDYIDMNWYYSNLEALNQSIFIWNFQGNQYPDPTHSNSLQWDMQEDKIYLNSRHFNQFYKIDHSSGNVDWIAGQNGNFTMKTLDGSTTNSLWYHGHDVNYVGNNEFVLFDNDFNNLERPDMADQRSNILHIKIDEATSTIEEVFRWTAPKEMFQFAWGSARLLENGNYLGGFGFLNHGPRTSPWQTDFGGVGVEVTPQGEVVWQVSVPYNWGWFRIQRIPFVENDKSNNNDSPVSPIPIIGALLISVILVHTRRKSQDL